MFKTIMEKEIFEQPEVLKNCLKYNEKTLDVLAEKIKNRNIAGIVCAARGSSDNTCTYFKYAIESLTGIPVVLAAPSVISFYGGKLNLKDYVVLGVSQSGAAADAMAVLENGKEQNALTISLTNNLQSKMANMTDFHLYCNVGEEKSVAATKTYLSQMYLLALLAAKIADKKELVKSLENLSEDLNKILALKEEIKFVAEKYTGANMMIVLARGLNYAIAQETSLKLQETCYLNARPYAASDFVHGPFALVDENTNVVLIAPSGESYSDMMHIKGRLLEAGAKVIVYTDNEEGAKDCTDKILLPIKSSDYISPFYNVVISQILACFLSMARGLNPDAPRGLKKVTVTK